MPSATLSTSPVSPASSTALRPPALLTATDCTDQVHLVIGNNALASSRCAKLLEVGATVKLIAPTTEDDGLYHGLVKRVEEGEIEWIRREFVKEDLTTLGREEVDRVVDRVFVTLPVDCAQCTYISSLCRRLRIPVNVVDAPALCTFSLLSTHTDGPLQIGVTTSGNGCKLANRIRREIAAALPVSLGKTCDHLGVLRRQLWDHGGTGDGGAASLGVEEDDSFEQRSTFNSLVIPEDSNATKTRRIRWLSQICEYWPLEKLCALREEDIETLFQDYITSTTTDLKKDTVETTSSTIPVSGALQSMNTKRGSIQLVGSGPGHPDLLTRASVKAIQTADLVLADKLVPAGVLALVPRRTELFIAKKFPGNADAAQQELLDMGLRGLKNGQKVVRLKQGDPYIYGRGAEEFDFFRDHGYIPSVVPGISSGICAPLFAGIPATHRGVADQVLLCTGTGRKGAAPDHPEYVASRTTVFLMALHRLRPLIESLCGEKGYPKDLPCAVIERASCPDQRIIRSTLEHVSDAVEEEGSRPPGLLVVGWACNVLHKTERRWSVEEGFKDY